MDVGDSFDTLSVSGKNFYKELNADICNFFASEISSHIIGIYV